MAATERIHDSILYLYNNHPDIHIDKKDSKIPILSSSVRIVGVYKNIFQIEENVGGEARRHTLPYTDILGKQIAIRELKKSKE